MNAKVYPFLLGLVLSTVVFALVSFKHEEKIVEKEQMVILVNTNAALTGGYDILISKADSFDKIKVKKDESHFNYTVLVKKLEEYQREGWRVHNSNMSNTYGQYYLLERDKK